VEAGGGGGGGGGADKVRSRRRAEDVGLVISFPYTPLILFLFEVEKELAVCRNLLFRCTAPVRFRPQFVRPSLPFKSNRGGRCGAASDAGTSPDPCPHPCSEKEQKGEKKGTTDK
jgi:hypothetical protein